MKNIILFTLELMLGKKKGSWKKPLSLVRSRIYINKDPDCRISRVIERNHYNFKLRMHRSRCPSFDSELVKIKTSPNLLDVEIRVPLPVDYITDMIWVLQKHNIPFELYKKAKELSETQAALEQINSFIFPSNTIAFVIGDGKFPRTALPLVLRKPWKVVVIDPALSPRPEYLDGIKGPAGWKDRLEFQAKRDDEYELPDLNQYEAAVIVGVHSHNDMKTFWERITIPKFLVTVICCVNHVLDISPDVEFRDYGIASSANLVRMWNPNKFPRNPKCRV